MPRFFSKIKQKVSALKKTTKDSPPFDSEEATKREIQNHHLALQRFSDQEDRKRNAMYFDSSMEDEANGQGSGYQSSSGEPSVRFSDEFPDLDSLYEDVEVYVPIDYSTSDTPFTTKPSYQKGLGLFATRDIKAGCIILREAPLLCCSDHLLEKAVSYLALSPTNKAILSSLQADCNTSDSSGKNGIGSSSYGIGSSSKGIGSSSKGIGSSSKGIGSSSSSSANNQQPCSGLHLTHIWANNAISLPPSLNDQRFQAACLPLSAIYSISTRTNHACDPNAAIGFTRPGELHLWALRDIPAGHEITRSYLAAAAAADPTTSASLASDRAARWATLGFQCTCRNCVTFPALPPPSSTTPLHHNPLRILSAHPLPHTSAVLSTIAPDERARMQRAEDWAAAMQADLQSRFDSFRLTAATCLVVDGKPPAIVATAMLVDLADRQWSTWVGRHLKHVIATGPELPKALLVRYGEGLAGMLGRGLGREDLKAVFMEEVNQLVTLLERFSVPRGRGGMVHRTRLYMQLKEILGIEADVQDDNDGLGQAGCDEDGDEGEDGGGPGPACGHSTCCESKCSKTAEMML